MPIDFTAVGAIPVEEPQAAPPQQQPSLTPEAQAGLQAKAQTAEIRDASGTVVAPAEPAAAPAAAPAKIDFAAIGARPIDFSGLGARPASTTAKSSAKPVTPTGTISQGKKPLSLSVEDFAKEWWDQVNPVETVKGLAQMGEHPIETGDNLLKAQGLLATKAKEAFQRGNYVEGVRHSLNYMIPVLGIGIDRAGDLAQEGEYAKAGGATAGIATNIVAPELAVRGLAKGAATVEKNVANANKITQADEAATATRQAATTANEEAAVANVALGEAKIAAPAKAARETKVNQTAGKRVINNVARKSSEDALEAINTARQGAPGHTPLDVKALSAKANSFGEAADVVQAAAKEIYTKLDEVSNGGFTNLREVMKGNKEAIYNGDKNAAILQKRLEQDMDALFKKHAADIGPNDLKAATAAWRTSKVMEELHTAVEGSFKGASETIASRAGTTREVMGKTLNKRLNKMLETMDQADVEKVIGKAGIDNLYRVAEMTKDPVQAAKFTQAVESVAKQLQAKAQLAKATADKAERAAAAARPPAPTGDKTSRIIGHITTKSIASGTGAVIGKAVGVDAYTGALAGMTAEAATRFVVQKALSSPRVGKMLEDAVRVGATAKVYGPLIAQAIRAESAEENEKNDGPKK